jgi:hypothetical protein
MAWQDLIRSLGTENAPFGFGPDVSPSQGAVDPAYNAGMQMIGNVGMGMLASGERNPMRALGRSYLVAQNNAQEQNKNQYIAAEMMSAAEEKKQKRQEEAELRQKRNDWLKSVSDPKQRATLEAYPELADEYIQATDPVFQQADANGGSSTWGMQVVPLRDKDTGKLVAGQFNQSQGGLFVGGQPADPNKYEYDPASLSEERASGTLSGNAPRYVVETYTKEIRPQMSSIADTVTTLNQAKTYLKKGIQTGSMADNIQALRSLGAQLGFNVDERVLADTQSYQNFIGNVVIPRMKELGGNDSNEELKKLYSLSGGDITQSLSALTNTIDFIEQLQRRKFKTLKASEDVALRYIPGLTPIDLGGLAPPPAASGGVPDMSTMSQEELEAIANGQ